MGQNLLYNVAFVNSTMSSAGVKTTLFGNSVDMSDCEGCLFITVFSSRGGGEDTSGAMHLQCSTYTSGGFANYGSTIAMVSTGAIGTDKLWVIDCYKPTFRYMRAAVYKTTAEIMMVNMKYNMRKAGSTSYRDDTDQQFVINVGSS